jgi:hypothetical protein
MLYCVPQLIFVQYAIYGIFNPIQELLDECLSI